MGAPHPGGRTGEARSPPGGVVDVEVARGDAFVDDQHDVAPVGSRIRRGAGHEPHILARARGIADRFPAIEKRIGGADPRPGKPAPARSEEHTSELQSLMRISYAVFCLKKK